MEQVIKNIISDIGVELMSEFHKNFERKAFFNEKWKRSRINDTGSLMLRTGSLRRSIRARVSAMGITFSSDLPYATIHNEGGEIEVTRKMKRFFWAMYYKHSGGIKTLKNGGSSRSKSSTRSQGLAGFYQSMALMPIGKKIKIPKRQFLGTHPNIDSIVKSIIEANVHEYFKNIKLPKQ